MRSFLRNKWCISVAIASLCLFILFWFQPWQSHYRCKDCNVILISIDTLRADHLGCYGYDKPTTPQIDSFSNDAARFSLAIAQGPSTAVSHASIFTGVVPSYHGAFITRGSPISSQVPTVAELLRAKGFATAAFTAGGQLNKDLKMGFERGFDSYSQYNSIDYTKEFFSDRVGEGINWLEANSKNGKFFLFLHTYEVHHPYAPKPHYADLFTNNYKGELPAVVKRDLLGRISNRPEGISAADLAYIIALYDAEIRSVDTAFATLIGYLKQNNLYDSTIIVLTSDHGEEFGEHGRVGHHSHTVYDELLKVPLLVKFPKSAFASKVVDTQVRSLDIVPTLLDILDLPLPSTLQGETLVTALYNKPFNPYAISQRDSKHTNLPTAVRSKKWKATRIKLYDLENDPGEKRDVSKKYPEVDSELKERIYSVIEGGVQSTESSETKPNAATQEQLKTLGYL